MGSINSIIYNIIPDGAFAPDLLASVNTFLTTIAAELSASALVASAASNRERKACISCLFSFDRSDSAFACRAIIASVSFPELLAEDLSLIKQHTLNICFEHMQFTSVNRYNIF